MKQIIFDIETIADEVALERVGHLPAGAEYVPWPLVQVACVSALTVTRTYGTPPHFALSTWSRETMPERAILREVERALTDADEIVTYNGRGYDVPVLTARAAASRIAVPTVASLYLNTNGGRHTDLLEVVSGRGAAPRPKLAELCAGLGVPAKLGAVPGGVTRLVAEGDWAGVRRYCEGDVISTYVAHVLWSATKAATAPFSDGEHENEGLDRWEELAGWITANQPLLKHLMPYATVAHGRGGPALGSVTDDGLIF